MPAGLGGGLPITSVNAKIGRRGDLPDRRPLDRDRGAQRHVPAHARRLFGRGRCQPLWREGLRRARSIWRRRAPNAHDDHSHPGVARRSSDMQPGAYVITAKVDRPASRNTGSEMATQWFIVTDLGLTTVSGEDGVHAFVRSLTSAQPVADAKVRLVAVNNEILGEAVTDAEGRADFAPGLARGEGGRAPQLIVAETDGGDYAFLDVSKPAFDLTDRGVEGRPSPGPLDLFATTERGVYRPGETVFVTGILRDAHAKAVADLPLTLEVQRPDGVIAIDRSASTTAARAAISRPSRSIREAMRGSWRIRLLCRPEGRGADQRRPSSSRISSPNGWPSRSPRPRADRASAKSTDDRRRRQVSLWRDCSRPRHRGRCDAAADQHAGRLSRATRSAGSTTRSQTYREPLGVVGTTDEDGNAVAEITLPRAAADDAAARGAADPAPRRQQWPRRRAQPDAVRCWPMVDRIGVQAAFEQQRRPAARAAKPGSTSSPSRRRRDSRQGRASTGAVADRDQLPVVSRQWRLEVGSHHHDARNRQWHGRCDSPAGR